MTTNETRVDFYESIVEDLIEKYKAMYKDMKRMVGSRPYGWVKMTNLQKLAWLEEITQDDPKIMGLYEQIGFQRLMDLLQEKDKLQERYQVPETGEESVIGKLAVDRDSALLRQYLKNIMYPKKGEPLAPLGTEGNAGNNGNSP